MVKAWSEGKRKRFVRSRHGAIHRNSSLPFMARLLRRKASPDIRALALAKSGGAFATIVKLTKSKNDRVSLSAAKEVMLFAYGPPSHWPWLEPGEEGLVVNIVKFGEEKIDDK